MQTFKKILRFRLPDDIVSQLNKMKRKSEFVRSAILKYFYIWLFIKKNVLLLTYG
jgi:hypothetical protein